MRHFLALLSLSAGLAAPAAAQRARHYQVQSPDGATVLSVDVGGRVTYSVTHRGRPVLDVSPISLTLAGGRMLGGTDQVRSNATRSVRDSARPVAPTKRAVVPDHFNELRLSFDGYSLELRAYDEGIAYRWLLDMPDSVTVMSEEASFAVAGEAEGRLGIDTT
ncbi:MAG: glycoside hydrolase family 97 N-terminal domain-containing protein, partial [bacterium]